MIQSSKFCTFVCSAAKVLAQAFLQSRLYAILLAVVNFFADAYAASKTRVILIGKGDIERFAPEAALYKGLGGLVGGFIGFFAGICRALRTGAADSAFVMKRRAHVPEALAGIHARVVESGEELRPLLEELNRMFSA